MMAKSNAVWGIDIGQCSLKALRCTSGPGGGIVADKYDYIEYPKILSQADADPEELVREAIEQFLSRNSVVGDKVAVSVAGQQGLSRFFKPPPAEARKLPDLVKYEVTQQIPFPIEDVIWDWQQLGGTVEDGRTIDAEVGIFAMKREAVYRALSPFNDADIEVDFVQLSPLAIFNVICNDIIDELPDPANFDPENPPPSIVVISMGTDTTDLIVTNGIKLWLRNIPIGGSHFTKQLAREMKLTQAKAEHLKRNARMAENPKEVFQAMRPVFNDLVNEVQRSLTFFESMDKSAEISEVVLMGNAAKLPGLRQYLTKQLELDVRKIEEYRRLSGSAITGQKSFDENLLSFAPCYGLCLQAIGQSELKTNLLPKEMVIERIVRAKKPWILASVGAILLGCVLSLYFEHNALWSVDPEYQGTNKTSWKSAVSSADRESKKSAAAVAVDEEQKGNLAKLNMLGAELSAASDSKTQWMEVYSAIFQALPKDPTVEELRKQGISSVNPAEFPFAGRKEIYIDHLESMYYANLGTWYGEVKDVYARQTAETIAGGLTQTDEGEADEEEMEEDSFDNEEGQSSSELSGEPGWVIELQAHHFHNFKGDTSVLSDLDYVRSTIVKELSDGDVVLPDGTYKFSDLGVTFPTVVRADERMTEKFIEFDPAEAREAMNEFGNRGKSMRGGTNDRSDKRLADNETTFSANLYSFVVQMAWQPRSPEQRNEARQARLQKEKEDAEALAKAAADESSADGGDAP